MGIGAIYHTVNPRLFPEQIVWIINHAEDRVVMTDLTFVPLLEKLADKLAEGRALHRLHRQRPHAGDHAEERGALRRLDRRGRRRLRLEDRSTKTPPPACATRPGTTGNPKGVLYSHRSNVLHALIASMPTCSDISPRDVVMPVVPLFHANGWALAFSAPMVGARLVMPGMKLDGASVYELLNDLQGDLHGRRADGVARTAAIS